MRIGVAKEIKPDEYRVALTPAGALELVQRGHEVLVEAGAGAGSAFADGAYEAVGARIVPVDEVWATSELLLKVKEPIEPEYDRLREDLETVRWPVADVEARLDEIEDAKTLVGLLLLLRGIRK